MPSFTGKGKQPHQGGNESEGRFRGQGSVMFTGISCLSLRGCLGKSHWKKGQRKGHHRGFLPSFAHGHT